MKQACRRIKMKKIENNREARKLRRTKKQNLIRTYRCCLHVLNHVCGKFWFEIIAIDAIKLGLLHKFYKNNKRWKTQEDVKVEWWRRMFWKEKKKLKEKKVRWEEMQDVKEIGIELIRRDKWKNNSKTLIGIGFCFFHPWFFIQCYLAIISVNIKI